MGAATQIADRLAATRAVTHAIVAPLDDAALLTTPTPIMSPPVWDLGHIAAYEELWIGQRLLGRPSRHPELQAAYDAFETPRAKRTEIQILGPDGAREYLAAVRSDSLAALETCDLGPTGPPLTAGGFAFDMVAQHEAQHTETLLQALQLADDGRYRPPPGPAFPGPDVDPHARVEVDGGTVMIGAGAGAFAYDCERGRHPREIRPFAIDRYPVTCARHIAFIDDGGYRRPELWTEAGWAWRSQERVEAPLYWSHEAGRWTRRRFDRVEPVDPAEPVCHVSWFEADAHARWAGGRLPTEFEWEAAACAERRAPHRWPWGGGDVDGRANLGAASFGPAPIGAFPDGASPAGCEQMIGDVWEWTASPFRGYPGFMAFPYREYAEVFFGDTYRVLRGGSWATQAVAARTTFRNWDLPQRRQIYAGFRLAWTASPA